jgi:EDD domain protein, DegV family
MRWNLLSDSSCDLPADALPGKNFEFIKIPLKIIIGGTEYFDDDGLNLKKMRSHMKNFGGASSSACPAPEEWAEYFRQSDCSLAVTMTGALSGTYNSAVVARDMVLEEFPKKKIHVFDSRSASGGLVLILRRAAALIDSGADFETVVQKTEEYAQSLHILFTLSSYDNLVKTGRMSRFAGMMASSLGIRAVAANTPEGTIEVQHKVRGEQRALERMVETMKAMKNLSGKPVVISHCDNLRGAQRLRDMIAYSSLMPRITILETRGLTSFYAEEGGILAAF